MARALVLGASGHIGAHIVRALVKEGHSVRAAYRNPKYLHLLQDLPVEKVRVDLEDGKGIKPALKDCEWVFHAAGYYPSFRENRKWALQKAVWMTRQILADIRKAAPSRVVFTSSAATFRQNSSNGTPAPLYPAVKIAMEQEVLKACQAGFPAMIVNPTLCVGELDAHPFSGKAILAYAKRWMPFYFNYQFNAVYTGDVGVGHVRAAERGRVGERYLLGCRDISVKEFGTLVAREMGRRGPSWRLPAGLVRLVAGNYSAQNPQKLDTLRAVQELGMPQTPLEEAIPLAVKWFKENGYV